jgi:uncharacterized protein involved in exopolysaccharide biosynthesis
LTESSILPPERTGAAAGHSWTIIELARLIIRRWKRIAIVTVLGMAAMTLIMDLTSDRYVSTATILPSGKNDNMSALKEVVGISTGGGMEENSSVLYPVVLQSRTIADALLGRSYMIEDNGRAITVVPSEYFGTDNPDQLRQVLADITTVTTDRKTSEIYLSVETTFPELSRALVTEYLTRLEEYHLDRRKSLARETQRYLASQILASRDALGMCEANLAEFRRRNSDWAMSSNADILYELTRLQREVEVKSGAYLYLQQQYEAAKLDAQKDVPIVRVLDQASLPTLKSRPRRTLSVLLAGIAAFFLSTLFFLIREYIQRESTGTSAPAYAELRKDIKANVPGASRVLKLISPSARQETATMDERKA